METGDDPPFHHSEAISAVEEVDYGDDEDFDDLYNDVNIGDGFFDSSQQPSHLPQKPLPPPPLLNKLLLAPQPQ
jgi:cleavage and polyadenylation specificity factor subunit 6/7